MRIFIEQAWVIEVLLVLATTGCLLLITLPLVVLWAARSNTTREVNLSDSHGSKTTMSHLLGKKQILYLLCLVSLPAAYCLSPQEDVIGLTHIFLEHDSWVLPTRIPLLRHCEELRRDQVTIAYSKNFTVDARYDYRSRFAAISAGARSNAAKTPSSSGHSSPTEERKFHSDGAKVGSGGDGRVGWFDLAEAAREHLVDHKVNHSLLSNKVNFWRLFSKSQIPIPLAFGAFLAEDLLDGADPRHAKEIDATVDFPVPQWTDSGRSAVCAAVAHASELNETLLLKPAHLVMALGRYVFPPQVTQCSEVLEAIGEILGMRAIRAAFHMHEIQPGVMLQSLWSDPPRPLVPRLWRWLQGETSVMELKIVVVWGKAVLLHSRSIPSLRYLLPDGTSEVHGNAPTDWAYQLHGPRLIGLAQRIARASGIPSLRVDFFASPNGRWALNEIEVMQGEPYNSPEGLESCMADLWLAPYLLSNTATPEVTERGDLPMVKPVEDVDIVDAIRNIGLE